MAKQTHANGRKTKAPQAFCSDGNDMPMMKLHVHDDRLPSDMAAGRGALSKSSVRGGDRVNYLDLDSNCM